MRFKKDNNPSVSEDSTTLMNNKERMDDKFGDIEEDNESN